LLGDSDVHVVVVIREGLHDLRRPGKSRVWANEDELRPCGDKAIHQILRKRAIDLSRPPRFAFAAVAARVVDVDVQTVLMRFVIWRAKASAEVPTVATTEIPDAHARRARMLFCVRSENPEHHSNETRRCEAPIGAVG
jgi:hypothetical protein